MGRASTGIAAKLGLFLVLYYSILYLLWVGVHCMVYYYWYIVVSSIITVFFDEYVFICLWRRRGIRLLLVLAKYDCLSLLHQTLSTSVHCFCLLWLSIMMDRHLYTTSISLIVVCCCSFLPHTWSCFGSMLNSLHCVYSVTNENCNQRPKS